MVRVGSGRGSGVRWGAAMSVTPLLQNGNLERAADWLFSHADELDAMEVGSEGGQATGGGVKYRDGPGSESRRGGGCGLMICATHAQV